MICPKCGTDASDRPNYCRKCGSNLALVGKALALGDTISRGDGGLLPKLKAMVGDVKLDAMSEQVSRGLEQLQGDIEKGVRSARDWKCDLKAARASRKSPEERRARLLESGFTSFFSGIALAIVLYFVGTNVTFRIPPEAIARAPFDIEQMIRLAWLFGLIPMFAGIGRIMAGFAVGRSRTAREELVEPAQPLTLPEPMRYTSVTEATTGLLDESPSHAPLREAGRQQNA